MYSKRDDARNVATIVDKMTKPFTTISINGGSIFTISVLATDVLFSQDDNIRLTKLVVNAVVIMLCFFLVDLKKSDGYSMGLIPSIQSFTNLTKSRVPRGAGMSSVRRHVISLSIDLVSNVATQFLLHERTSHHPSKTTTTRKTTKTPSSSSSSSVKLRCLPN
jgi:hypothetical protein